MKKLFALILAVAMMLGCTALADDITWEQVEPAVEAAGITGEFYTFEEIALEVFVPTGMVDSELPDDSYIGYFAAEDGSALAVQYVNADGMDLDTYAAGLEAVGATEIEMGTVNGLPCVTYEVPANKTVNVAFATQEGYILEAVCGPVETEDAKTGAALILARRGAALILRLTSRAWRGIRVGVARGRRLTKRRVCNPEEDGDDERRPNASR